MKNNLLILILTFALFLWTDVTAAIHDPGVPLEGTITGKIIDESTGEPLIGATVMIVETSQGDATDLDGNFNIKDVEPGTYTLRVSFISYATKVIEEVEVETGEVTRLEITMLPETSELDEVVVSARSIRNNEAALLAQRQKAITVSNAISAEYISKSGSSNAADAMEKVTGASVVDGKYVYVRGLGDRYMNTRLNGSTVPSSDPERNAVPFDLFPSSLLDNITTTKTFSPDMPGDFTGGSVNIKTKDYPDKFEMQISASTGFNSSVGLGGDLLLFGDGRTGFLGGNGGSHQIPDMLADPDVEIPSIGEAFTNEEKAMELDMFSNAFGNVMSPRTIDAPIDGSFSVSVGNRFEIFGKPLGLVAAFSQSRNYDGYSNGESSRFQLTSNVESTDELNNDFRLQDQKGTEEVLWGGLANLSLKLSPKNEINFNFLFNKNVESTGRFLSGAFPRDLPDDALFQTRVLSFQEKSLNSFQLSGDHVISKKANGVRFEWNASIADTEQDEPDLRFFTNDLLIRERNGQVDSTFAISPSIYPVPTRYFRNLQDDSYQFDGALSIPFDNLVGTRARLKIGGSYSEKDRVFSEREFQFRQDAIRFDGDEEGFFEPGNLGIDEERTTDSFFRFGNFLLDNTQIRNSYTGDQTTSAAFGMLELNLFDRLRFSGGMRLETTDISVQSRDTTISRGRIDESDLLPSVNLVYELSNRMNLRFAYGKTIARPTFREMAPFAAFNFVNSNIVVGNPELEMTRVDNFDARWEWFIRPGEILAVSFFYKNFENPIEKVFNPIASASNPEIQFQNVNDATVFGAEFEVRKRLDQLTEALQYFDIGFNMTLAQSNVDIAEDELSLIRALDPSADDSRRLQGQSPFVINADLSYSNPETGTNLSAFYNIFGKRMTEVSVGGTPNVFEFSRNQVDLVFDQRIVTDIKAKISVKNLLKEDFERGHTFKGNDFLVEKFELGRSFSVGVSYSF
ncbi:MAG TPA: TonB-dependent receptor [Balneolaceae bacterium]|nr:TonB-dependent receptor [Balneolaceae bacterium]